MFQFLLTKLDLLEARGQKQAYSSGRLVAMTKDGGGYIDPWYALLYAAACCFMLQQDLQPSHPPSPPPPPSLTAWTRRHIATKSALCNQAAALA